MKKQILFLFVVLFYAAVLHAQSFTVSLVEVDHTIPNHNGSRYEKLQVDVTDGTITIKSDTLLTDVKVVVKDQFGNIMHVSSETIDNLGTTISIHNADGEVPASIDLFYDDRHMSGDIFQ